MLRDEANLRLHEVTLKRVKLSVLDNSFGHSHFIMADKQH